MKCISLPAISIKLGVDLSIRPDQTPHSPMCSVTGNLEPFQTCSKPRMAIMASAALCVLGDPNITDTDAEISDLILIMLCIAKKNILMNS